MQTKEAIILAGGLGTRLRSAVPDLPKCMAPVNGKPFISYVINYLQGQGIQRFIFSLGYKHEEVIKFITLYYPKLHASFVVEDEPLGTGGAIKLSCTKAESEHVLVTNGDTLFKVDCDALLKTHVEQNGDCSLALKPMKQFDRYGVVELNEFNRVKNFKEKQFYESGLINGGLYALKVESFMKEAMPQKFSFEKEYLEALFMKRNIFGIIQDAYFIDIGIPEDFEKAQHELIN